jgi:mannosyltransferase
LANWLVYGVEGVAIGNIFVWPILLMIAAFLPDWFRHHPLHGWWRRLLPILGVTLMLGSFLALGLYREANIKFLLPAQILLMLWMGRGLWLLWEIGSPNFQILAEALPRLAAIFAIIFFWNTQTNTLNKLYYDPRFARDDYRTMAQLLLADERPADAIILNGPNQVEVFSYYYQGNTPIYGLPLGLGGDAQQTRQLTLDVIAQHRRIFSLYWGDGERDPDRVVEQTLTAHTFEIAARWFGNVRFVQYAVMPPMGPPEPLNIHFGESIVLLDMALTGRTARPGDALGVALTWQADRQLQKRYKVTVQLLNPEQTRIFAQHDGEPGNNMALTTTWQLGTPIDDSHGVLIPLDVPPGQYTLVVGLYDSDNPAQRLAVGEGTLAVLAEITVQ